MTAEDAASHWPTESLILKYGRKRYRTSVAPIHWQLRSLISAEGQDVLYYPTGRDNNNITRLNTTTRECECIKILSFHPRCFVARDGWICCGGEHGEFAIIRDVGQTEGTDSSLTSDFRAHLSSLDESLGSDASMTQFSREMLNMLERRLNGPTRNWTTSSHKFGRDRVNCVTIWTPPKAPLLEAKPGAYPSPVAVLSNNDKTVTVVGLYDCEGVDELEYPDCVNRALISPDGTILAAICDDPYLYIHTRQAVNKSRQSEYYDWKAAPRIKLKDHKREDVTDCRGTFTACFSHSGRYLAVGTQFGSISIFDTAALGDPEADPLITYFDADRAPEDCGAVRDMAFCPGPYDLLAWTEHRGRVGIADARSNFHQRQIISLDKHDNIEHISLNGRNTIDPRLLEHNTERTATGTSLLSNILGHSSSRPLATQESSDPDRLNHPFTAEETAILDAIQNERRRREAREQSQQREQSSTRGSPAWRSSLWAERRETLTRILERERSREAREQNRSATTQTSSEQQDRERRVPLPRRRSSSILQALVPSAESTTRPTERAHASGNNDASTNTRTSTDLPWLSSRLGSGWTDLEALYNLSGGDEGGLTDALRDSSRTGRTDIINEVWNDDNTIHYRRAYGRHGSRDHRQFPDDTAGLCWSEDGRTLFVAAEDGIYEFPVNLRSRLTFPELTFR